MTVIDPAAPVVTLINHFTVDPSRQKELVEILVRAGEDVIRYRPGFVTANIHASLDGTRVVNYAQWESEEAMRAMLADPACREHTDAALRISTAEPLLYRIEAVQQHG